jgi:CRISPR-associated protein Csb3
MNVPKPNITVNVDMTNPGQFFACCGLLELADRLWPGAEGWFDDSRFCMACNQSVSTANQLLSHLLDLPEFRVGVNKKSVLQDSKLKLLPFMISFPDSVLRIDWWRDEMRPPDKKSRETCSRSPFKTWSGNQSPQQIIYDRLLPALRKVMKSGDRDWFSERFSLTGRFGFDHTAAVKSIDAGWSPDKLNISVKTSPAVELLAMIGLQRFQPVPQAQWDRFAYRTWREPTVLLVAPAKMAGAILDSSARSYVFDIEERGDYKFFTTATPQGAF